MVEVGQRIIIEPSEVFIDKISLEHFIKTDSILKSINQDIAEKSGHMYVEEFHPLSLPLIDDLIYFNIDIISKLVNNLKEKRNIIVILAVNWISDPNVSRKAIIFPSTALKYLI